MNFEKYVSQEQFIKFTNKDSFTLVKVAPFSETIEITAYRSVGSIKVGNTEHTLYDPSITGSYNFKLNSGVSGCSGRMGCSGINPQSVVEELLERTVPDVSILANKPTAEIWYICKDLFITSFSIDVIRGDILALLKDFYSVPKKEK